MSDDLISRQMLLEYIHGEPVGRLLCDKYNLDGLIEQLPSAQPEIKCIAKVTLTDDQVKEAFEKAKGAILTVEPERKKGHWIGIDDYPYGTWECDQCGCIYEESLSWAPNFCPNCGARMEEENEGH